jgi:hypothetical protein
MKTIIESPSFADIKQTKFDEIDVELILFYYQSETSHENDHDTAILYKKNNSFILYHEHENAEQESFYRVTVEVSNLGKELNYFMDKEFVDYIKAYALNYKLETEMKDKPAIKKLKI